MKKVLLLVGVLTSVLLLSSISVFAASTQKQSPKAKTEASMQKAKTKASDKITKENAAKIKEALKNPKTKSKLKAFAKADATKLKEKLDEAVTAGKITQEKADKALAAKEKIDQKKDQIKGKIKNQKTKTQTVKI